jgi:2-desacetyl-2-hydroxyethyl bacteriochlorophyllide A dehydrogenase
MIRARVAVLPEIALPSVHPFQIEEIEIPPLTAGAVLGRMVMAGVCGTDVHILHGKVPVRTPAVLGHENVARVEAIGGEEPLHDITGKSVQVGDLITWLPKSCMQCYNCTILGDPAKCERRLGYGGWVVPADQHPYLVGGFAEYVWILPGSDIVVLPPDLDPEAVVLGDALRIMVHGLERIGGLAYGDTVVVQGCGAVGLMGLILAKDAGAGEVIVTGAPASRLELAKEYGADEVIDITQVPTAERIRRVLDRTNGRGADVIFECAGVPAAVAEGLEMVRVNGKYLIAGHYGDAGTVPLNPHLINKKQITITGVWSASNRHFLRGLHLLRKIPLARLVTHRFPLEQINEALIAAEKQETLKAAIVP